MKVVNPNDTEHLIVIITRFAIIGTLVLFLYNEETQVIEEVASVSTTENGLTTLTFDYTFKEDQRFQMRVNDDVQIVYRDIIKSTSQNTQDFKSANGLYYYE
jgi:hypothetical protein